MACASVKGAVGRAPLTGEPRAMNVTLVGKLCQMHAFGPMEQCTFTEYKQGCCCGTNLIAFEVPILGYNTTPGVYMTCEGGLVPEINPPYTPTYTGLYPPFTPSSTPVMPPPISTSFTPTHTRTLTPTPSSAACQNKVGVMFLLVLLSLMVL